MIRNVFKYEASWLFSSDPRITKLEVKSESDHFITFIAKNNSTYRVKKESDTRKFFDSFADAKDHLIKIYNAKVIIAMNNLVTAKRALNLARQLKEEK